MYISLVRIWFWSADLMPVGIAYPIIMKTVGVECWFTHPVKAVTLERLTWHNGAVLQRLVEVSIVAKAVYFNLNIVLRRLYTRQACLKRVFMTCGKHVALQSASKHFAVLHQRLQVEPTSTFCNSRATLREIFTLEQCNLFPVIFLAMHYFNLIRDFEWNVGSITPFWVVPSNFNSF